MSKAAFIIYTRTKCCDYPSRLNVYPNGIPQPVYASMREVIVSAAQSIDTLDQDKARLVIYSAENCVIAGMVAFLKYLADGSSADVNMYTDAKGRSIYAFVGLVFKKGQKAPLITKASLWEGFKKYMSPVWERSSYEEAINAAFEDFAEAGSPDKPQGKQTAGGINFYTINGDDSAVFEYYLEQAARGEKVSFCSNIVDFRVINQRPFKVITTTPNIIARAKKELSALSAARKNSPNKQSAYSLQSNSQNSEHSQRLEYVNNNHNNLVGDISYDGKWDRKYTRNDYYELDSRTGLGTSNNMIQLENKNTNIKLSIQISLPNKPLTNPPRKNYRIMIWEESDE